MSHARPTQRRGCWRPCPAPVDQAAGQLRTLHQPASTMAPHLRRMLSAYPRLVTEFDAAKNAPRTPKTVSFGSNGAIWWRCARAHEWQASPSKRTQGQNCPYCSGRRVGSTNALAARNPDIATSWHPTKNGVVTPNDVTSGSGRRFWWACAKSLDHVWCCAVLQRTRNGCPFCAGRRVCASNSLAVRAPRLAREWHPSKNEPLTPRSVVAGSARRVWWRCRKGHEWATSIANRFAAGHDCPACAGQKVTPMTSLAARVPAAMRFWHPTKNLPLTPWDVTARSGRRVWWRCTKGPDHEWEGVIGRQGAKGGRCPFCSRRRLSITNCLATRNPRVAHQWHPKRNGALTPRDVMSAVGRSVWWLCPVGHEWKAIVGNRTGKGSGCPVCSRMVTSRLMRDRKRRQRTGWRKLHSRRG